MHIMKANSKIISKSTTKPVVSNANGSNVTQQSQVVKTKGKSKVSKANKKKRSRGRKVRRRLRKKTKSSIKASVKAEISKTADSNSHYTEQVSIAEKPREAIVPDSVDKSAVSSNRRSNHDGRSETTDTRSNVPDWSGYKSRPSGKKTYRPRTGKVHSKNVGRNGDRADQLERVDNRRLSTIRTCMTKAEEEVLASCLPHIKFEFTRDEPRRGHPVLYHLRRLGEEKIVNLLSRKKVKGSRIVDIGLSKRAAEKYPKKIWGMESKSDPYRLRVLDEVARFKTEKRGSNYEFCRHEASKCTCNFKCCGGMFIHSIYYNTPDQVARILYNLQLKAGDSVTVYSLHHRFGPNGKVVNNTNEMKIVPGLNEGVYKRSGDNIRCKVNGNLNVTYCHPNIDWLYNTDDCTMAVTIPKVNSKVEKYFLLWRAVPYYAGVCDLMSFTLLKSKGGKEWDSRRKKPVTEKPEKIGVMLKIPDARLGDIYANRYKTVALGYPKDLLNHCLLPLANRKDNVNRVIATRFKDWVQKNGLTTDQIVGAAHFRSQVAKLHIQGQVSVMDSSNFYNRYVQYVSDMILDGKIVNVKALFLLLLSLAIFTFFTSAAVWMWNWFSFVIILALLSSLGCGIVWQHMPITGLIMLFLTKLVVCSGTDGVEEDAGMEFLYLWFTHFLTSLGFVATVQIYHYIIRRMGWLSFSIVSSFLITVVYVVNNGIFMDYFAKMARRAIASGDGHGGFSVGRELLSLPDADQNDYWWVWLFVVTSLLFLICIFVYTLFRKPPSMKDFVEHVLDHRDTGDFPRLYGECRLPAVETLFDTSVFEQDPNKKLTISSPETFRYGGRGAYLVATGYYTAVPQVFSTSFENLRIGMLSRVTRKVEAKADMEHWALIDELVNVGIHNEYNWPTPSVREVEWGLGAVRYHRYTFAEYVARFPPGKRRTIQREYDNYTSAITGNAQGYSQLVYKAFIKREKQMVVRETLFEPVAPRVIMGVSALSKALAGPWFLTYSSALKLEWNIKHTIWFCSGYKAMDFNWWIANTLRKYKSPYFVGIDYTKYDITQGELIIQRDVSYARSLGFSKRVPLGESILKSKYNTRVVGNGIKAKFDGMRKSGCHDTSSNNTRSNGLCLSGFYTYYKIKHNLAVLGDDSFCVVCKHQLIRVFRTIAKFEAALAEWVKTCGFKAKILSSSYICDVEFLSMKFYPAKVFNHSGMNHAVGKKPGRCLTKLGWLLDKEDMTPAMALQIFKGVLISYKATAMHVPFLRVYIREHLTHLKGVRTLSREQNKFIVGASEGALATATADTWDAFDLSYGYTLADERRYENQLRNTLRGGLGSLSHSKVVSDLFKLELVL